MLLCRQTPRIAALLAVLGLAACGGGRQTASADPVAACTQLAQRDTDVQAIRSMQLAGFYQNYLYERDYKQALNRAIDRCLAADGMARPGGVQAIRNE